jgi:uncharacterized repeat protein (TIGR01451 family)
VSRRRLALFPSVAAAVALVAVWPAPSPAASTAATGSWQVAPAPSPAPGIDARLASVACVDAADCWAVGSYFDGNGYRTLIEHDTGGGWAIVPSPDGSDSPVTSQSEDNALSSISCLPTGTCWAVGYWYDGTNHAHTLVEENSGSGWTIVSSPNATPLSDSFLSSVTCVGASDCWAVGSTLVPGFFGVPFVPIPGTPAQTLIEHYDGSAWSIVSSPDATASENVLNGVACAGTADCWAVGIYYDGTRYDTLVEQNTGNGWAIVSSASPSSSVSELDGAACVEDGKCSAVGIERTSEATQALAESGSSNGWALDGGADTNPAQLNALDAVTCVSDADCWAAGEYDSTGQFLFQTLIEERTGAGWKIVPSPDAGSGDSNVLQGIGCAGAGDCWAVGFYTDSGSGTEQPLIEHYAAAGADLSVVVSGPATARPRRPIAYTIAVHNEGPDAAQGVQVADPLPPGLSFRSATTSQGSCAAKPTQNGVLTCSLGPLAAGSDATVTLIVRASKKGTYTDTATVSEIAPGDPIPANNTSRVTTAVTG